MRARGSLDDRTLRRLRQECNVEQVYETTGIEGSQLDLQETRLVIERGITITGKPLRDSQDALNMKSALDFLEELADSERELTPQDIRDIQRVVVGSEPGAGSYRSGDVLIAMSRHVPPPPTAVPGEVQSATQWLARAGACPALLTAAVLHAWIAHIHPFADGNGRTARAVMNLILIRAGYPVVLIRRKDRNRYYDALGASDDGDIAPLTELIIKRSEDSFRQVERVRAAETGVTEAVLRQERQLRAQYETWRTAMLLMVRAIEEFAETVRDEMGGSVRLTTREYEQVTEDDFAALARRDASGNGWLATLRGRGMTGVESELLLWVGYRSDEAMRLSESPPGPSVFLSEPDPEGHRPFRWAIRNPRVPIHEIWYDGGQFVVRRQGSVSTVPANELAAELVKLFVDVYLSAPLSV